MLNDPHGFNDDEIKPKGVSNYIIPPPSVFVEPSFLNLVVNEVEP